MKRERFLKHYRAIRSYPLWAVLLWRFISITVEAVLFVPIFILFVVFAIGWVLMGWAYYGVVYGTIKAIAFVFTKTNHIPCFLVTITATPISAALFEPSVHEPVRLWVIALGTGILCGLLTEGLRRCYVWCEQRVQFLGIAVSQNRHRYFEAMCASGDKVIGVLGKPVFAINDRLLK